MMLCDQVRILYVSGNGMHIAQVITDLLGIFAGAFTTYITWNHN
jgi:hypothetical protein